MQEGTEIGLLGTNFFEIFVPLEGINFVGDHFFQKSGRKKCPRRKFVPRIG